MNNVVTGGGGGNILAGVSCDQTGVGREILHLLAVCDRLGPV